MKTRNMKMKEVTRDRISELPGCIVENILSRLEHPRWRVRMSVLSKEWFALTSSLPVLEFDSNDFWFEDWICYCSNARETFYKYVERTVSRFCRQQNVMDAHTFKLCTVSVTDAELKIIDACLKLILLKGVQVLEIMIPRSTYCLPDIVTSASLLTSLKVSDCMLPSSLVDVANFKSLKVLQLNYVPIDPLVIKHLIASCPLLEELIVKCCSGKQLCVNGQLRNLKKAHFLNNAWPEKIDIDAPNLREFQLGQRCLEGRGASSVNLGLCKQLRTLLLDGSFFPTSTELFEFLSNFPILENLSLCYLDRRNSLTISNRFLRQFELTRSCELEKIDLDTPNLILFSYSNSWITRKSSAITEIDSGDSNPRMECHIINHVDTIWFQKLRGFLEKSNRFKVLILDIHIEISVNFEKLKTMIQLPPYELEHVKLNLAGQKTNDLSVVDSILWCCHTRSLSLTSYFYSISDNERSHILKLISARLLQQEDKGTTDIRIEWSFSSNGKIYSSWNSMLPELPADSKQTLTFIKEEVSR